MSNLDKIIQQISSFETSKNFLASKKEIAKYLEQYSKAAKILHQTLEPIRNSLSDPKFLEALKSFTSNYQKKEFLKKRQWGLTPYLHEAKFYSQISDESLSNYSQQDTDQMFINYFLDNDCYHLEKMINEWFKHDIFKKRKEVLDSLLFIVKTIINSESIKEESLKALAYSIIPTLISTIEGVCRDFANSLGLIRPKDSNKYKKNKDDKVEIHFWGIFGELPSESLSHSCPIKNPVRTTV